VAVGHELERSRRLPGHVTAEAASPDGGHVTRYAAHVVPVKRRSSTIEKTHRLRLRRPDICMLPEPLARLDLGAGGDIYETG